VSEPSKGALHWLTPNPQFLALQVGPAGLGPLLVVAGYNFGLPLVMDAGASGIAASAVVSGLASMLTRRIVFLRNIRGYHLVVYHGGAAVLVGFGFLVLGIAVGVGVIAHLGGQSMDEIRDALLERPWRALVPAGMFLLTNGLAMIIGFEEGSDPDRGILWNLLTSIPSRLGCLIGSVIGAATLFTGVYELLNSQAFDDFIERLSYGWPW